MTSAADQPNSPAPALPAVPPAKQCLVVGHPQFGAVAVQRPDGMWGVMNPGITDPNAIGGHWAATAELDGAYTDLPSQTAVEPPPDPKLADPPQPGENLPR